MIELGPLGASIEQVDDASLEECWDYRQLRSCVASVRRDETLDGMLSSNER